MMELDVDHIKAPIIEALEQNKLDGVKDWDKVCAIIYPDGGAVKAPVKSAGCGVHGYFFIDEPVKSNSSSPKGFPTKDGYTIDKVVEPHYKVNVLSYFDYRRGLGENTNNFAELSGGLFALRLVEALGIKKFIVLSDSQYFVNNLNKYLDKWAKNDYISNGKELANKERWMEVREVWDKVKKNGKVVWVKGHSNDVGNKIADTNATMAINMDLHPKYQGEEDFVHDLPKAFWDRGHDMSPLFTERRLILHSEGNDGNIYFQMSMGEQWPSKEHERLQFIGKRIADTCISVVVLPEPEPVIELISEFCRDVSCMDGLVCGRLDLLTQGSLYHEIKETKTLSLRQSGKKITSASKVEVLTELKPARLSWRIACQFEWIAELLMQFITKYGTDQQNLLPFKVLEVTGDFFQIKETKKEPVYELKEVNSDEELVEVNATMNGRATTLTLTMNVDIPSKRDLQRMAKSCPEVHMIYWSDNERDDLVYFATIFRIGEEYGLWCSAYSNFHMLPVDYKDNLK